MTADQLGRTFKKLRVSLTNECNYACVYCSERNTEFDHSASHKNTNNTSALCPLPHNELMQKISLLHSSLKLSAVRLTGGEPLLHHRIAEIVSFIANLGISNIGITTNGHLLANKALELKKAGLKAVNISIDGLSADTFKKMSRYDGLKNVLSAIDASIEAGLNVKLNTVVMAGSNTDQIIPLLEFAMKKGVVIRFLELMAMGPLNKSRDHLFFPKKEILDTIASKYVFLEKNNEANSTAHYWEIDNKRAFGIIANDSTPFCGDCNRLRLDSLGNIYGCLSNLIPINIEPNMNSFELESTLQSALSHKQQLHFSGNARTMQSIGG